jgi:argininosuccinate lyase
MSFRTAQRIVGRLTAWGIRPGLAELNAIFLELAGFPVRERCFSVADLERARDTKSNVALRANPGGPAPAETERIAMGEERLAERRGRTERALGELGAEK